MTWESGALTLLQINITMALYNCCVFFYGLNKPHFFRTFKLKSLSCTLFGRICFKERIEVDQKTSITKLLRHFFSNNDCYLRSV